MLGYSRSYRNNRSTRSRRNPSMSVSAFADMIEQFGDSNLARLIRKYEHHPKVSGLLAQVANAVADMMDDSGQAESAAQVRELSDKEAWAELAQLVLKVGKEQGWPEKLISALHAAFMDESRKA